ncbi:MAG: helix-turn-helix transcriptional regulator [Clostridium sp.]|nr:helix-turn-helix transcriptional regulator [Clostridium sp.]
MQCRLFAPAIDLLAEQFKNRNWVYYDVPSENAGGNPSTLLPNEKMYRWPGGADEEIMVCVHKGNSIQELFHRQDFFFFNFAYCGNYGALSYKYDNHILIQENECYIGQPYAGYALYGHSKENFIIIGVLIRKDTFFKSYLSVLSADTKLFHFFLEPQTKKYSDEFIHLKFEPDSPVRTLLEMMVMEYAYKREDTQAILKPLVLTLLMHVARQYAVQYPEPVSEKLSDKILQYMSSHSDVVALKDIAKQFSYHPNYISALLRRETGKSFSEILLEQRMERAASLLKRTDLPIEEIAQMLGYSNSSNFYKAFRVYYGKSPREYIHRFI